MNDAHPEAFCQQCRRRNVVWFAPSDIWNATMGGGQGILCPVCFIEAAERAGLHGPWIVAPGHSVQKRAGGELVRGADSPELLAASRALLAEGPFHDSPPSLGALERLARAVCGAAPEKCPDCDGVGWTAQYNRLDANGEPTQVQCERCYGHGVALSRSEETKP